MLQFSPTYLCKKMCTTLVIIIGIVIKLKFRKILEAEGNMRFALNTTSPNIASIKLIYASYKY